MLDVFGVEVRLEELQSQGQRHRQSIALTESVDDAAGAPEAPHFPKEWAGADPLFQVRLWHVQEPLVVQDHLVQD
jgi:hypothetical protein